MTHQLGFVVCFIENFPTLLPVWARRVPPLHHPRPRGCLFAYFEIHVPVDLGPALS
jgi:hypothetical protein